MWHVDDVIKAVKGAPLRIEKETFASISTDSRTIGHGDLFVPLSGANFDGHLFISKAYEMSQGGTICEKKRQDVYRETKGTVILVDNALDALLDLARWKRERMSGISIAITGSNGKTTTKEILVDMMKRDFSLAYNEKNYNNLVGVSQSILTIDRAPQFFVFELGTNARGEIATLARTTRPDLSLITNINPSHLEGLSDLEGVLAEKLDLFYLTKEGGRVFVNADDPYILPRYHDAARTACVYGISKETPFHLNVDEDLGWRGSAITITLPGESLKARTPLLGKHNLYNILAASAIAHSVGLDTRLIRETIETFRSFAMRFTPIETRHGYIVVDDTYNANPASMEWAIRTLENLPCNGKRVAVLGDMKELGETTTYYHKAMGKFLKESSIPMIVLIGENMKEAFDELGKERAAFFEDKKKLIDFVAGNITRGDTVLIKGSRAARMDEIVEALI